VAVSHATLKIHQEHHLFRDTPFEVIHNSVKLGVEPTPRERDQTDKRLCFGFLGRVDEGKGFNTLMDAFSRLPKDKVRLVVGGRAQDDYIQHLETNYSLDNVDFFGFTDPSNVFAQMDVLVFPSYALEALGNGVYEAYFRGIPVIGADNGGIPEMIEPHKTGFVFPIGDADALESHMLRFIDNPHLAPSMQQDCLEKAEYFKPQRRLNQYEQFLSDTVTRHQAQYP
jgi:glycosyltransferase involved in cell wall biosynthesis